MDSEDGGSMGFQHRDGGSSQSVFKTSINGDPFDSSSWDQLVSLNQSGNFGGSSHMVHYQSDSVLVDMVPKIPSFGNGSFSEMVTPFGLPEMAEKISHQTSFSEVNCENAEDGADNSSLNGKRKRRVSGSHSPLNPNKNVEEGIRKVSSKESLECSKGEDEKKESDEHCHNVVSSRNKQTGKQLIDSTTGEPSKDNYLHMRAKRGQATNSHSLAERVRRERISERMRLLQELVPGCNKITGKAMMLDEIINYVQSLQQQVEFLSMKLSTVNPEVNVNIERLLSKDILHSRGSSAANLGLAPGLNSSHHFQGIPQGPFAGIQNIMPQFNSLPQNIWDNEFQSVLQMGFDSNPSANNLGPNA